jgi:signal transduction histidine kinase
MPSLFLSGAAFSELGNKDSADNYFRAAVNYSDSVEFFGLRWTNDRYYIPYLIQEGRIDEARARALQLFKIGEDHHNADIRLTASEFLSTIYNGLHQPDSAYYFSKAELSMKDSVFSENNMNKEEALAFNEKLRGMEEKRQAEQREKQKEQNLMYIAIGFGVFVLVVLFLFQLKARRKEMKDRLADQRERISKELHDNVGSQLSFISGNIDWLIDSFGYLSKEQEINKLNLVSETSKTIVNELRETIWAIKKETIKLDELSDKVKSFLLEQTSIYPDIETEIVENIQKEYQLQPNESLNVYRICQEAIHNCLKHAQASRLRLHILSDPRKYYLISISDNGKGFDTTSRKQGHFGLDNMMQRARESGVSLTLKSEPGKGTEVTVMKLN